MLSTSTDYPAQDLADIQSGYRYKRRIFLSQLNARLFFIRERWRRVAKLVCLRTLASIDKISTEGILACNVCEPAELASVIIGVVSAFFSVENSRVERVNCETLNVFIQDAYDERTNTLMARHRHALARAHKVDRLATTSTTTTTTTKFS